MGRTHQGLSTCEFERGIVNGHSAAMNLITRAKPNC